MNINPLWGVCILVRLSLIMIVLFLEQIKNNRYTKLFSFILGIMGIGFLYKYLTGSNNEFQISKVFWHQTRITHGILYLLASITLFKNKFRISSIFLLSDIFFSVSYRLLTNN
jgi:hypothetical protein